MYVGWYIGRCPLHRGVQYSEVTMKLSGTLQVYMARVNQNTCGFSEFSLTRGPVCSDELLPLVSLCLSGS